MNPALTARLETPRLILRAPAPQDVAAMLGFLGSERARFYGGPMDRGAAWKKFAAFAGQWLLRGDGLYAITLRDTGETIGLAGPYFPEDFPEPEMAWLLTDARFEGQGLAQEACQAVLAQVFGPMGWRDIVSYVDADNTASLALAARLGAVPDAAASSPLPGCLCLRHHAPGAAA